MQAKASKCRLKPAATNYKKKKLFLILRKQQEKNNECAEQSSHCAVGDFLEGDNK